MQGNTPSYADGSEHRSSKNTGSNKSSKWTKTHLQHLLPQKPLSFSGHPCPQNRMATRTHLLFP
ncbi:hypothetical protein COCSUDRAFT_34514 [Coccomyxa subellipsoidea C-169]|uniref:Uncharacterized protein n=1 Tax=Coccomyxa subellipsoidea (strain C-169) TaxID=574566 RepID=I0YJI2_COCSC|nr:hypothetical protein COCSUDRAFT_34514 [Coccomyxa subellipsoidea C-169]EIE18551.1 hypothetical protein COCSUDRAFT_34514 [Coccomyxa subellipsoidea C-169]|eukprot:XP_005643095.1 hypothetical protein COCSUDRAFT_34514 [Coccomyxa subellipsoidea C-169]